MLKIVKYCKQTHKQIATKEMTFEEWKAFKKFTKEFYYRAYQKYF